MQTIMQKGTGAYQFGFYNNKIGLYKYTGSGVGTIIAQSTGTQTDTTAFHHYVATKNGATVKIYVDGVDVTGTVSNQTLTNTASVLRFSGTSATERLNGYADEIAVYNQVLSATTIGYHYAVGTGGNGTGSALGHASSDAVSMFTLGIRAGGPAAEPVRRRR